MPASEPAPTIGGRPRRHSRLSTRYKDKSLADASPNTDPTPPSPERPRTSRLPRSRHATPWSLSVLVVAVVIAAVAAPLWIDPISLGLLAGAQQPTPASPTPPPLASRIPDASPAYSARTSLQDDFERSVKKGWGSAGPDADYSFAGAGAGEVTAGHAVVTLTEPGSGSVNAGSLALTDVSEAVSLTAPRTRDNGPIDVIIELRTVADTRYQVVLELSTNAVSLAVDVVVDGQVERLQGPVTLDDVNPSGSLRIRAEVVGRDPSTIRARVWNAAQVDPGQWAISVIDWKGRLQVPGGAGIGWIVGAADGQAPVELRFDDLLITTFDAGGTQ